MAVITFPDVSSLMPESMVMSLGSRFFTSESPYSGYVQSVESAGSALWRVSTTWPSRTFRDGRGARKELEGLLFRLRNRQDQVNLWDFASPLPRSAVAGSITTSGTQSQFSRTLTLTGPNGNTLLPGDKISIVGQLFVVTVGATFVSATASVSVDPPIRTAIAAGQNVTYEKPTAKFMMASENLSSSARPGSFEAIQVDWIEVI